MTNLPSSGVSEVLTEGGVLQDVFGEPIFCYSRQQAIEDGVLVDLTEWAGPQGMMGGFTVPVAVTASIWNEIEDIPDSLPWQDTRGRAHDVLYMARIAAARAKDTDRTLFQVLLDTTEGAAEKTYLLVIGPGDEGEPVVTIMQTWED